MWGFLEEVAAYFLLIISDQLNFSYDSDINSSHLLW